RRSSDLTVVLLLNPGHEATGNVTGIGWWQLFRHPDQLARLRREPGLLPRAVDELLRYDTPLQLFERWVLEDVEIGGVAVPKGAELGLLFGSANRDPAVFEDPDRLDLARAEAPPHPSFGAGVHHSGGAPLGRLELELSFGTLLARLPRMEPAAEPAWKPTYVLRGLEALDVTVCPGDRRVHHVRARLHLPGGAPGRPGRPGVAGGGRRGRRRRPLRRRHQPPARGPVRAGGPPPRRHPAVAPPRGGRPAGPQGGPRRRRADAGRRDRAGPGAARAGGPHRGRGRGETGGAGRRPHHRPLRAHRGGP